MTSSGCVAASARLFDVAIDKFGDAVDERMFEPLVDRLLAPGEILLGLLDALALEALGEREQSFGRIGAAVEDDVFAGLAQFGVDLGIDRKLAGVDDAHIHAGVDGVIEKHRMHRLAHRLVAAKREGQIGDAAGNMHERKALADFPRGFDEIDAVIIVLFDAGRDRENIRIEDDVFGRKADLLGQDLIGARADLDLALQRIGLALFVEGHDDDGGAIGAHGARVVR